MNLPDEVITHVYKYLHPEKALLLAATCKAAMRVFLTPEVQRHFIQDYYCCSLQPTWPLADQLFRLYLSRSGLAHPECVHVMRGVSGSFQVTSDESYAFAGSREGHLRFWNLSTGACSKTIIRRVGRGCTDNLVLTPDGKHALCSSVFVNGLELWSIDEGTVRILEGSAAISMKNLKISSNGERAIFASRSGQIKVLDLPGGACLQTIEAVSAANLSCLTFTLDEKQILSTSYDGTMQLYDLERGAYLWEMEVPQVPLKSKNYVSSVQIHAARKWIIAGCHLGQILIVGLELGITLKTLDGHSENIRDLQLIPDGVHLLSGSFYTNGSHESCRGSLRFWNLETGECLWNSPVQTATLKVTSDGSHVFSGGTGYSGSSIKFVDLKTGKLITEIEGHTTEINQLYLKKDGLSLISKSADDSLRLWNLAPLSCRRYSATSAKRILTQCVPDDFITRFRSLGFMLSAMSPKR